MAVKQIKVRAKEIYEETLYISTPFIKLDSALKLSGAVSTGGQAKMLIEDGLISVNGEVCTLRGRKIYAGDKINFKNSVYRVENSHENK